MAENTIYQKDFNSWSQTKPVLHSKLTVPPIAEREIWWCSIGINIGNEMDGKNGDTKQKKQFTRPVLILKKLGRQTFIGLPLTTKLKDGTWYYPINVNEKEGRVIFSQIRMFDCKRLQRKIEKLSESEFSKVKKAFVKFIQ
jgi:mRNA interferase MazF